MTDPIVSIIIPCGPKHAPYLPQALASCQWQTVKGWEAIVINDTGGPLTVPPQVRTLPGRRNVSANRNAGIAAASAPFVVCLDADDYLLPNGLELFLRGYAESRADYVYSDCYALPDGVAAPHPEHNYARAPDYDQGRLALLNLHTVTALVPTQCVREAGGFDERVNIWEDWTLWLRLAQAGVCGERLSVPTFVYRLSLGDRRSTGVSGTDAEQRHLMDQVLRWYRDKRGDIPMAGCGCGGSSRTTVRSLVRSLGPMETTTMADGSIKMEYTGLQRGSQSYRIGGTTYRGGNNASDRYAHVLPEHVEEFKRRYGHVWKEAPQTVPVAPPIVGQADDSEVPEVAPVSTEDVQPDDTQDAEPKRRGRSRKDAE